MKGVLKIELIIGIWEALKFLVKPLILFGGIALIINKLHRR